MHIHTYTHVHTCIHTCVPIYMSIDNHIHDRSSWSGGLGVGGHTTMGLVGCMARLLTDMRWPLKVLARFSAFTSTGGKLSPATGLLRTPPCTHTHTHIHTYTQTLKLQAGIHRAQLCGTSRARLLTDLGRIGGVLQDHRGAAFSNGSNSEA